MVGSQSFCGLDIQSAEFIADGFEGRTGQGNQKPYCFADRLQCTAFSCEEIAGGTLHKFLEARKTGNRLLAQRLLTQHADRVGCVWEGFTRVSYLLGILLRRPV